MFKPRLVPFNHPDFDKPDDAAGRGLALAFLLSLFFYGGLALAILKFCGVL